MSIRVRLKPLYVRNRRAARTLRQRVRTLFRGGASLAHQGMQRSGTNYACVILVQAGFAIINEVDPNRSDPRHKHYRWQDDKATILMDPAYMNDLHVSDVHELNRAAGFPAGQRHVVVMKNPYEWVLSIARWAEVSGWIEDAEAGLRDPDMVGRWLREWDAYYRKWIELADKDPQLVLVTPYEFAAADPSGYAHRVAAFAGVPLRKEVGPIEKVAHSTRRSGSQDGDYVADEIRSAVDVMVTADWRRFAYVGGR